MRRLPGVLGSVLCALAALVPLIASALTPIDSAELSADVTTTLDGSIFADEDAVYDDFSAAAAVGLGAIPPETDLVGYHVLGSGEYTPPGGADLLLVFDSVVTLPGGLVAEPRDVVRWDGATHTLEFDGSAAGVPEGVRIDALSVEYDQRLILSFDTTLVLGGYVYEDDDLVGYDGSLFTAYFDGATEGVPEGLDLDGASVFRNSGKLVVSFDGSGTLGGQDFDDEDALEYDGANWELAYDGSAEHAALAAGDMDVIFVPEPGRLLGLACSALPLAFLARRRTRAAAGARIPSPLHQE